MVPQDALSAALLKAGANNLRPAARVYLANRLTKQAANGGVHGSNLGGLRDVTIGAATSGNGLASFADIDAAAAALVAVADRAAPMEWANSGRLDIGDTVADIVETAARVAAPGTVQMVLGPSAEAQSVFRALTADWENFDRLGVGDKIFGPGDPRGNLRDDAIDWRKFRDDWLAGNIPGMDVAARLNVQRAAANKVRKYLADAKVIDPALAAGRFDEPGVDAEKSTSLLQSAASVDREVKKHPWLASITNPSGPELPRLPGPFGKLPTKWVIAGAGVAALLMYLQLRSSKTVVVVERGAHTDNRKESP